MLKALEKKLNQIILGKPDVIRLSLTCLLANGHLLIEDIPGMGKTTLSHAIAHFTGMNYQRIQFTSDLLPSDLLGVSIYNRDEHHFQFHPGPIFSQLILADEINRATPKTQSALLEAMEERQVTTEQGTKPLPTPFFVIATQNPLEQTGTYPLPESQLDRFLMRISIGYPPKEAERELLTTINPRDNIDKASPITDVSLLLDWQMQANRVNTASPILDYVQNLLQTSREQGWFHHGLSPRAGKAIVQAAQAYAYIDSRDFVRTDDVQAILGAIVNHRLIIRESTGQGTPADMLLNFVEVPV